MDTVSRSFASSMTLRRLIGLRNESSFGFSRSIGPLQRKIHLLFCCRDQNNACTCSQKASPLHPASNHESKEGEEHYMQLDFEVLGRHRHLSMFDQHNFDTKESISWQRQRDSRNLNLSAREDPQIRNISCTPVTNSTRSLQCPFGLPGPNPIITSIFYTTVPVVSFGFCVSINIDKLTPTFPTYQSAPA